MAGRMSELFRSKPKLSACSVVATKSRNAAFFKFQFIWSAVTRPSFRKTCQFPDSVETATRLFTGSVVAKRQRAEMPRFFRFPSATSAFLALLHFAPLPPFPPFGFPLNLFLSEFGSALGLAPSLYGHCGCKWPTAPHSKHLPRSRESLSWRNLQRDPSLQPASVFPYTQQNGRSPSLLYLFPFPLPLSPSSVSSPVPFWALFSPFLGVRVLLHLLITSAMQ